MGGSPEASTTPLAGCVWVASRATFCRDLQSCDVQTLKVSRRSPFESLTLHHEILPRFTAYLTPSRSIVVG